MTIFSDDYITLLKGDVLAVLPTLPAASVHMIATSPPFFGLRNYGLPPTDWPGVTYAPMPGLPPVDVPAWRGCLGLEPDVLAYVGHLVLVCRALRRVLRDDGTFWLNLGDSYAANRGYQVPDQKWGDVGNNHGSKCPPSLKPKDLIGVPDRVRFALQADGWYVRSAIVWAKGLSFLDDYAGSVMPESVRDRPTSAYEMVYLLTKGARYFYDAEAVKEAATDPEYGRQRGQVDPVAAHYIRGNNKDGLFKAPPNTTRNLRNVWAINPAAFPGAHYAVFPPALVAPMIEAGTSEQGVCAACGAPWERVVEHSPMEIRRSTRGGEMGGPRERTQASGTMAKPAQTRTVGFRPTCDCYRDAYLRDFPRSGKLKRRHAWHMARWWKRVRQRPVPFDWPTEESVVLDPFAGSATTCTEARRLGRRSIGIDLGFDEDVLRHRIEHAHHRTNGQLHVTPSALGTQEEADLGPLFSAP